MRTLLFYLSFFILKCSFGQEIELKGKYGASFIGGETIEFVGSDSFYFSGFYCTNGFHGKGQCEIRNNYLYLYFEKSEGKRDLVKSPEITKIQTNDSVAVLNINCVYANGNPVSYSTVQLIRKNRTPIVTLSDSLGHISFAIRKYDMPLTIKTSSVEYVHKEVIINIEDYGSYNIRTFNKGVLFDEELNSGEVYVYEIDELSEDLILMRPEKSNEPFRKYRKRL